MTIYRGNKKVIGIYRGASKVVKVYDGGNVIFEPEPEIKNTNVIAKYNITSTSSSTKLVGDTNNISAMYIDGVEVTPVSAYTFSTTGEHTVEYVLINKKNTPYFGFCSNLTNITIPDGVTSIEQNHFSTCKALVTVELPDTIEKIELHAFYKCEKLEKINIGKNVKSVLSDSFFGCNSISFTVDAANTTYYDGGNSSSSCIIKRSNNELVAGGKDAIIPDGVQSISNDAFYGRSLLTSINIPNSVTSIGNSAFNGCSKLTSIEIPDSVTSIGNGVFSFCTSIKNITIGNGITSIGKNVFDYCASLTSIEIPDGVTSIGLSAFKDCRALTTIVLPSSLTHLDAYVFQNCTSLTSITCNATTAPTIHSDTFFSIRKNGTLYYPCDADYTSLLNILVGDYEWTDSCGKYVPPTYQIKVTYVGTSDTENGTQLIYNNDSVISAYNLTYDKESSVDECYNAQTWIPSGETLVMLYTLKNYESRAKVPNNLLAYTTAVKVSLSDDYTEFGYGALENCKYLTDVYIYGSPSDWNIYSDFMSNTRNGGTFHVKSGYKSEFGWLRQAQDTWNIVDDIDSSSSFNPELTDEDTEINVSGNIPIPDGAQMMATYTNDAFMLYNSEVSGIYTMWINGEEQTPDAYRPVTENDVVHFRFESDSIPNDMFKNISLQSVVIYDSISSIGDYAFNGCNKLMSIEIPDSVTNIWSQVFENCSSLTSVTIGSGIVSIGSYAFAGCTSLSSITCKAITEPSIHSDTFNNVYYGGTLYFPSGSYYATWLSNDEYYLGYYGWMGDFII